MPGKTALPPFSRLVEEGYYCYLDMQVRASRETVVSCAGRERCLPAYRVDRSDYGCYALEFVAEGGGSLQLGRRRYRLQPGHIFVYAPGWPHVITTEHSHPMLKYFVNFFGRPAQSLFHPHGLMPGRVMRVLEIETTRHLFEELIREGRKAHGVGPSLAKGYLELLFLKAREGQSAAARSSSRSLQTLQRCQQVLEKKFASLSGLADLSREAGADASHLCRIFKRFRQGSPHACLIRRKMDAAAALLTTQPLMIKEVAIAVGYEDALHFSRLFRGHFGVSPSEFQRRESAFTQRSEV